MMGYLRADYAIKLVILIAVYFVTAKFGLSLNAVSGFATLVWLPTGIALAATLLFGYRMWPGIALAAFLVNLQAGAGPLLALGIAAGNTLEAMTGAYLLNRFVRFNQKLEQLKDVVGLMVLAAVFSTMVSATVGVVSLLIAGIVDPASFAVTWVTWWTGDALGNLVIAPLILLWVKRPLPPFSLDKTIEAFGLAVLLVAVSFVVFRGIPALGIGHFTLSFMIFPVLIWVALRFGMRGSVTATFLVAVIAVWGAVVSLEPPAANMLSSRLLLVQSFVGVTAITFMTMAAIVSEVIRSQQQTVDLTKQRAHLLSLNRSKDEFITLASHQLRTPATAVKQYIGMMLDNYAGKLSKSQRGMLEVAYDSNERQLEVANSLLNVAQIDAGTVQLHVQRVDLVPLLTAIARDQTAMLKKRDQTLHIGYSHRRLVIPGDKAKLGMVFENIIDNASKYSMPGTAIEVELFKDGDCVIIEVKDEGVGITKPDQKKLFKKFSRIENPLSIEVGGTGLGLYWARKVVDLHEGRITVVSEPEMGSTFRISLPLKNE
jgi:signal transduction histidine kinase